MLLDYLGRLDKPGDKLNLNLTRQTIVRLNYRKGPMRHIVIPKGNYVLDAVDPRDTYPAKVMAFTPLMEQFTGELMIEYGIEIAECWEERIQRRKPRSEREFCEHFRLEMIQDLIRDSGQVASEHPAFHEAARLAIIFIVDKFVLTKLNREDMRV